MKMRLLKIFRAKKIDVEYPHDLFIKDNLELKIDYLKSMDLNENNRQSTIETKTAQLIGQTSIIFTLLGLFLANYFTKFSSLSSTWQTSLTILFFFSLVFYVATIFIATGYLNVRKYKYGQRDAFTVTKYFKNEDAFRLEEIKDLIYIVDRNMQVNSLKADNLVNAYRCFQIGTLLVAILSVLLFAAGKYAQTPVSRFKLENPIIIKGVDTLHINQSPVIIRHSNEKR
jgi:uncharacterized Tic20 family protein